MVIKIFGCILLVGASFMTGCCLSRSLYRRRDFLRAFVEFISSLETNIRYNADDIFTLVNLCAKNDNLDFFVFDKEFDISFEKAWQDKLKRIPKSYSLTKSDKQLLYQFGCELGKTDIDGQLKHMELYKISFTKQLSVSEEAIIQKSKLYKTMGFFAGTATALMII